MRDISNAAVATVQWLFKFFAYKSEESSIENATGLILNKVKNDKDLGEGFEQFNNNIERIFNDMSEGAGSNSIISQIFDT